MKRFLTTIKMEGSFDFYSSLIEIAKYDHRSKYHLERVLSVRPEMLPNFNDVEEAALFVHEYTHYLDVTCTVWGMEFLLRKNRVLSSLADDAKLKKVVPVFMLNMSEIMIHSNLLEINDKKAKLCDCVTEHAAIYSELYGPIITVFFKKGSETAVSVPLSMLSVLESNAYAAEVIYKIRFLEANSLKDELVLLEADVNSYLNSPEYSEYSLLIVLCRKHFSYLSLKECLIFYQTIAWRVMNMISFNLSTIASFLKRTFRNKYVGDAICKDLQRGMSRQVVVFKMILMLHEFVENSLDKRQIIDLIKLNPKEVIKAFFDAENLKISEGLDFVENFEFSIMLDFNLNDVNSQEYKMVLESSMHNHRKINTNGWGEISLADLILPDVFLADGTVVSPPQRIDLDIEKYFEDNMGNMIGIENIYKDSDMSKFHIHPDDVSYV